jgi:large subunit ribosomal protein L19
MIEIMLSFVKILNKRAVEASEKERPVPDIRTGDIVEIKLVSVFLIILFLFLFDCLLNEFLLIFLNFIRFQEVPENRRRLSVYKGIVISRQNAGIHTTIRIRRIIAGVGVEIVFPL